MSPAGAEAPTSDRVTYNLRLFLNQGEEVPLDELQKDPLSNDQLRVESDREVMGRVVTLGKREVVPAVERSLTGMRVGGYRKLRASPPARAAVPFTASRLFAEPERTVGRVPDRRRRSWGHSTEESLSSPVRLGGQGAPLPARSAKRALRSTALAEAFAAHRR